MGYGSRATIRCSKTLRDVGHSYERYDGHPLRMLQHGVYERYEFDCASRYEYFNNLRDYESATTELTATNATTQGYERYDCASRYGCYNAGSTSATAVLAAANATTETAVMSATTELLVTT